MAKRNLKTVASLTDLSAAIQEVAENKANSEVTETVATEIAPVENQISEQQNEVLKTADNTVVDDTLVVATDEVIEQDTTTTVPPTIEELKNMAANGDIEFETVEQMVVDGKITAADFQEILGVEYEAPEAETIGDLVHDTSTNNPPADVEEKPRSADDVIGDQLRQYKPLLAVTNAEAIEHVKEALSSTVEYISQGDTSLASKCAIAIADYVSFNNGGSHLITINSGMHRQILDSLTSTSMFSPDDIDSSFKVRVNSMIKRAILLMAGKISVGYFVLPADRKRVRSNDEAVSEFPTEVEEGCRVIRSTCIFDGVLTPAIPVEHKGTVISTVDNSANKILRLLSNEATDALYASLWDSNGSIVYHPKTGAILGFKSAATLAEEKKAEEVKKEREKLDAANADKAKRQTKGTQNEPNTLDTAKDRIAELQKELAETRKDNSAVLEAKQGDIVSMFAAAGAYIRDTNLPLPAEARKALWRDTNDMLRRRVAVSNVIPDDEEMLAITQLVQSLEVFVSWDDKAGTWRFNNVEGRVLREYKLDGSKAA